MRTFFMHLFRGKSGYSGHLGIPEITQGKIAAKTTASNFKNLPNELILFKRDETQDFEINHEFRDSFSFTTTLLRFPIKRVLKAAVSLFSSNGHSFVDEI